MYIAMRFHMYLNRRSSNLINILTQSVQYSLCFDLQISGCRLTTEVKEFISNTKKIPLWLKGWCSEFRSRNVGGRRAEAAKYNRVCK